MTGFLKASLLGLAIAQAALSVAVADDAALITRNATVRFPDLNLATREGATVLYQRIAHAASTMCSPARGFSELGVSAAMAAQVRECKAQAVERAVTRINAPMLTAVFRDKTHHKTEPGRLAQAY